MLPALTPQAFVAKWRQADLKERSAAQEHFLDLCRLVGHPTPAEADPSGQTFTFEAQLRQLFGAMASGFRYTPPTTFETFPFPWPPGQEPLDDPRVLAIAAAARELVEKRDAWLHPEETRPDGSRRPVRSEALQGRTLTNLYNARPTWLDLAHHKLDRAVLDAYGWPADLTNDQILEHLLALNLQRAGAHEITP